MGKDGFFCRAQREAQLEDQGAERERSGRRAGGGGVKEDQGERIVRALRPGGRVARHRGCVQFVPGSRGRRGQGGGGVRAGIAKVHGRPSSRGGALREVREHRVEHLGARRQRRRPRWTEASATTSRTSTSGRFWRTWAPT